MAGADLCEAVRRHARAVVNGARSVQIDLGAADVEPGRAGLDPGVHLLDAPAEDRARYVLILDTINFGSGWFHELRTSGGEDPTSALSRRLSEHARASGGPWAADRLQALTSHDVAGVLAQDPGHELMDLYAAALRALGDWLGPRSALEAIHAAGSAQGLAADLVAGMPLFEDPGFYKRAQITANDLVLAGVADFADADELTAFADNLVPHVLRLDGVLVYEPDLAATIDAGTEIPSGSREETEIRAATIVACDALAARAGVAPRVLDNWLWNRGLEPRYAERPAHRTRTTAY